MDTKDSLNVNNLWFEIISRLTRLKFKMKKMQRYISFVVVFIAHLERYFSLCVCLRQTFVGMTN